MTDNDNKDPQITPEIAKEFIAQNKDNEHYMTSSALHFAQAFLEQAAELKQLRAERAGLLEWVETKIAECHNSDALCVIAQAGMLELIKSKLTDSAQITTDTEGK